MEPLLAAPGDRRPDRVLDLGAGDGRFCSAARDAGCEVIAVELADSRLEHLRAAGFAAHARVDDVPHDRIDLARCHQILEHLPRPFETLRALALRLAAARARERFQSAHARRAGPAARPRAGRSGGPAGLFALAPRGHDRADADPPDRRNVARAM